MLEIYLPFLQIITLTQIILQLFSPATLQTQSHLQAVPVNRPQEVKYKGGQ